jgi:inner membrane protein
LCLIVGLAVVLLIPIAMIWGLVAERQDRSHSAAAEVSSKWGDTQTIVGPALILPYTVRRVEYSSGNEVVHTEVKNAVFLPRNCGQRAALRWSLETGESSK